MFMDISFLWVREVFFYNFVERVTGSLSWESLLSSILIILRFLSHYYVLDFMDVLG